jgi:DNA-binding LacI/PurR family transcriptional regulator
MRTTIKDVAKKAGVSPATVSLVLNNAPGVSEATRAAVSSIVQEVNYRPNARARSLSSRRSETIALVMPPSLESLGDPYFINLMCGVLKGVRDRGYKMLLEIADERFDTQRLWEDLLLSNQIDGLIASTPQLDQDYLKELATAGHPVLLINGERPDLPDLDYIGYDDVLCGVDATEYLIRLGHRRIGHLGGPSNHSSALRRREGYLCAMERAGLPIRPEDMFSGSYWYDSGRSSMTALLARPASERPSALFCANDTIAIGAIEVARAAGLRIPEDLSLVGVDDTGSAESASPPLTTMRQDIHAISSLGTARFLTKLRERREDRFKEQLPMTLIERQTSIAWTAERS